MCKFQASDKNEQTSRCQGNSSSYIRRVNCFIEIEKLNERNAELEVI